MYGTKLWMKMCFAAIMICVLGGMLPAAYGMEEVAVGFGTLKIGGIYQTTGTWYESDNQAAEFKLKRARLLLSGSLIPEKVKYFVQADGVGSPYVLDTKLIFSYIPKTDIVIGRFVPKFTLYMPAHTGKLDLINYPVVTSTYAMWRQTGIQSETRTKYVDLYLGIFNGYQGQANASMSDMDGDGIDDYTWTSSFAGNDRGDENDGKDFLVRVDVKPMEKLLVGAYYWHGNPGFKVTSGGMELFDEDYDVMRYGICVDYKVSGLHLAAEYAAGTHDQIAAGYYSADSSKHMSTSEVDSMAYFGQASYAFNEYFEVLARYDYVDPNTDVDDNGSSWITPGLNFSLSDYNLKFYLNYIMKDEEGDEIDNDELIFMAQFCF